MSEGGEGQQPTPEELHEALASQERAETPPVRLSIDSVKVQENLIPYVAAEFVYRDYWAEDGTPQDRAAKEATSGHPTSPEGEVYDELMGTAFPEVARAAAGPDGEEYRAAFTDLDAARSGFLLLALSRRSLTQRELYSNLGDIRIAPSKVDLTPHQAKLVALLASRASMQYDVSQMTIADPLLDNAPSRSLGRPERT